MSKGIKRKWNHCEDGAPSSPSTSSKDSGFDEDSMDNRSNIDDEINHDNEWETVSIPYIELPPGLFPVVNASEIDDESGLKPNSSTNIYISSGNENSSMNATTQTLNHQFETKRNEIGCGSLDSTTETYSNCTKHQKFSVFRSLDDEDGQTNTSSPTSNVLEHVFALGPTAESSTYHQDVSPSQQNITSTHQESLSPTEEGRSISQARQVPNRKVPKAKKSRSNGSTTSVKGLYSDIPLQSLVMQQFRMKQLHLNLSPRTVVQVETLISDMVGRIAEEAKSLVALSSKKRVDSRVLKYAIKLMLEHMKKEGDVAEGRSSAWLF